MSIIIELHRGKRFKSPAGFCKYAVSSPPRSSSKIYDYRYFCCCCRRRRRRQFYSHKLLFFTTRARASLPSALISHWRMAEFYFSGAANEKTTHRPNWTKARNLVVKMRSFQFMHYYDHHQYRYARGWWWWRWWRRGGERDSPSVDTRNRYKAVHNLWPSTACKIRYKTNGTTVRKGNCDRLSNGLAIVGEIKCDRHKSAKRRLHTINEIIVYFIASVLSLLTRSTSLSSQRWATTSHWPQRVRIVESNTNRLNTIEWYEKRNRICEKNRNEIQSI